MQRESLVDCESRRQVEVQAEGGAREVLNAFSVAEPSA